MRSMTAGQGKFKKEESMRKMAPHPPGQVGQRGSQRREKKSKCFLTRESFSVKTFNFLGGN